jgi:Acetyltransferase (GNAT) domain
MELRIETFRTKSELEVVRDFWISAHTHRDADFEFYQFISELFPHVIMPHVIAVYNGGKPKALIVGRIEKRSLDIRIGYWRLRTTKLRTLTFVHGGVIGQLSEEESLAVVRCILSSLENGEATLARFESLDLTSPLYDRAIKMPSFSYSDHFTNAAIHYAWKFNDKPFLECLSSNARYNHRRRTKRLLAAFPGAVRIERFQDIVDLDRLMCDAELVASKSYQRGLGVGFENSLLMRRRLDFQASKGWLRGYVLYIENSPCAFWIGSLHDKTFYNDFLGYDPDKAKYGPGMYLVFNVLEELFDPHAVCPVSALDLGGGEGDWKASLSNRNWYEAPVHIFASTLQGLCLNALRSAPAMINQGAKALLRETRLLAYVKRKWRARRASEASNSKPG